MGSENWKKRIGIVYSTNPEAQYDYDDEPEQVTLPPDKQNLRISLDKKQRAGKKVTLVTGFVGTEADLKDLCKMLKQACGVGGAVKDGELVIQGDLRDKVAQILSAKAYRVKLIN